MVKLRVLLGVLMVVGLVGLASGTFAYFSSSVSGTAKIATGNPDLVVLVPGVSHDFGNVYFPLLLPGDSGTMNLGEVQNQGTAGGDLYITVPSFPDVDPNLHIYACNEAGAIIWTDLARGGTVNIGKMDAKVIGGANDKFPIKIRFVLDEKNEQQGGNGMSYSYPVTVTLKTSGKDFGDINQVNNYYNNPDHVR